MKYSGFTLAEMLIAMAIVGVVAALTIPPLTSGTNRQEYRTSYRKAMDTLNRAIHTGITMDDLAPGDLTTETALRDYFIQRVNSPITNTNSIPGANAISGTQSLVFYTADGMRFEIPSGRPTATTRCTNAAPCIIWVDVNDTKVPNSTPANINNNAITDRFSIGITDAAAIPNGQTAINVMSRSN